jgi:ribosomal protein L16 Arg81 hydroxylase
MLTLDTILAPTPASVFLAESWRQRALFVPGSREKFDGFFTWARLNTLMNGLNAQLCTRAVDPRRLQLVTAGVRVDLRDLMIADPTAQAWVFSHGEIIQRCRRGDTLALNHLQIDHPPAADVAAAFRAQFHSFANVNAIASLCAGIQGFNRHADNMDVFVLQVEGQKRWRVYWPTDAETGSPYFEGILSRGDVLYVPYQHPHEAVAHGEASLHITVSVLPTTAATISEPLYTFPH